MSIRNLRNSIFCKTICSFVVFCFSFNLFLPSPSYAQAILNLPAPGTMVNLSPAFNPAMIRGITLYPDNPLKFDFIIDRGQEKLDDQAFEAESTRLIKYFLASLTVPENQMWVNLSPYEKNRIIPNTFGTTEMGRDLLAQDYMLKQLTSSMMYPEEGVGKEFWQKIYAKSMKEFGTTDVAMNTFNKIWIVPDNAVIYEHEKGAFIVKSKLKVMLEEDYLALESNKKSDMHGAVGVQNFEPVHNSEPVLSGQSLEIIRQVLIPEIEKEVNEGQTFANLRQIYNAVILANWYKKNLKQSLLGQIYVDKEKTNGVNVDPAINQKIYDQYVEAFKKGVFDYIKEDVNETTGDVIPRKYFSGGVDLAKNATIAEHDGAVLGEMTRAVDLATVATEIITSKAAATSRDGIKGARFTVRTFGSIANIGALVLVLCGAGGCAMRNNDINNPNTIDDRMARVDQVVKEQKNERSIDVPTVQQVTKDALITNDSMQIFFEMDKVSKLVGQKRFKEALDKYNGIVKKFMEMIAYIDGMKGRVAPSEISYLDGLREILVTGVVRAQDLMDATIGAASRNGVKIDKAQLFPADAAKVSRFRNYALAITAPFVLASVINMFTSPTMDRAFPSLTSFKYLQEIEGDLTRGPQGYENLGAGFKTKYFDDSQWSKYGETTVAEDIDALNASQTPEEMIVNINRLSRFRPFLNEILDAKEAVRTFVSEDPGVIRATVDAVTTLETHRQTQGFLSSLIGIGAWAFFAFGSLGSKLRSTTEGAKSADAAKIATLNERINKLSNSLMQEAIKIELASINDGIAENEGILEALQAAAARGEEEIEIGPRDLSLSKPMTLNINILLKVWRVRNIPLIKRNIEIARQRIEKLNQLASVFTSSKITGTSAAKDTQLKKEILKIADFIIWEAKDALRVIETAKKMRETFRPGNSIAYFIKQVLDTTDKRADEIHKYIQVNEKGEAVYIGPELPADAARLNRSIAVKPKGESEGVGAFYQRVATAMYNSREFRSHLNQTGFLKRNLRRIMPDLESESAILLLAGILEDADNMTGLDSVVASLAIKGVVRKSDFPPDITKIDDLDNFSPKTVEWLANMVASTFDVARTAEDEEIERLRDGSIFFNTLTLLQGIGFMTGSLYSMYTTGVGQINSVFLGAGLLSSIAALFVLYKEKRRVGGIDLNPNEIKMEIQRNGNGVLVPVLKEPISNFDGINGFVPRIINVTPITNLPLTLGLLDNTTAEKISSL